MTKKQPDRRTADYKAKRLAGALLHLDWAAEVLAEVSNLVVPHELHQRVHCALRREANAAGFEPSEYYQES